MYGDIVQVVSHLLNFLKNIPLSYTILLLKLGMSRDFFVIISIIRFCQFYSPQSSQFIIFLFISRNAHKVICHIPKQPRPCIVFLTTHLKPHSPKTTHHLATKRSPVSTLQRNNKINFSNTYIKKRIPNYSAKNTK